MGQYSFRISSLVSAKHQKKSVLGGENPQKKVQQASMAPEEGERESSNGIINYTTIVFIPLQCNGNAWSETIRR